MNFIILPNQLFDKSIFQTSSLILWEHPQYFTEYNIIKRESYRIEHP